MKLDGDGITVAVLDSSINRHHAAFENNPLSGENFIHDDNTHKDYWYSNREEHGTMVAGILAKFTPEAKSYVCCVSDNGHKGPAVKKALEHLGNEEKCPQQVHVVIMSFGHYPKKEEEWQELINNLAHRSMICVTAAGNCGLFGGKVASPACLSNVLAVGALDRRGRPADYNHPGKIDVYAPGENVCYPSPHHNKKYRKGNGTSCAAPAIGAIVALLIQYATRCGVHISGVEFVKKSFSYMTERWMVRK